MFENFSKQLELLQLVRESRNKTKSEGTRMNINDDEIE